MLLAPADEEWTERHLARLKEAHLDFPWASLEKSPGFKRLQTLLGFSPYATNLLVRRKDLLAFFLKEPFPRPRGPKALEHEIQKEGLSLTSWRDFALYLRQIKQREIIKILALDLSGESLGRTVFALSGLAEALLRSALRWLLLHQFPEIPPEALIILGLGKLGGRELNYSSDVDLVYFFHGPYHLKERYLALFRELTRLFDTLLEGERLFRVDLRLRPGGKEGELAFSLKAGLHYYFYQSHPFERLALVKAKPSAGHLSLAKTFLRALRPVVYPRFLDYAYLDHIRDLKERLQKEALKQGAERNLKIGPGGLREIEFFCQSLQMIYGGKYPQLRVRNTLWALRRLELLGLIPAQEAQVLREAYVFLRTLEHRLQTIHFRQTATLPEEETALRRLARSLGFHETGPFLKTLARHRARVREIFSALLEPQKKRDLRQEVTALLSGKVSLKEAAERLELPANLLEDLRHLCREEGPLGRRRAPILRELIPEIFSRLPQTKNPAETLAKLISFFERLGGRISFYHALKHRPEIWQDLLLVFDQSAFLSNLLLEAPAAAEALLRVAPPRKREEFLRRPLDEALSLLRSYKNEEVFRLGLEDLKGRLRLTDLVAHLSSLAEEIIDLTFHLASLSLGPFSGKLSVLGLGKLGGQELGYRSDLDLVFVAEGDLVQATRLAQRFLHYLSVPLPEGPGYQVDTRLRPEGRKGPLVVSLQGFVSYHQKDSGLWEKLALTRLRPLTGDQNLAQEIVREIRKLLAQISLDETAREEVRRMRFLMERERARPGKINLKVGPGGLADVEFIVQWLMLKAAREFPEALKANTLQAISTLKELGFLKPQEAQQLEEGYLFLRNLDQKLLLLLDKPGEEKHYTPEELEAAAPYLGENVLEKWEKTTKNLRVLFQRLI